MAAQATQVRMDAGDCLALDSFGAASSTAATSQGPSVAGAATI